MEPDMKKMFSNGPAHGSARSFGSVRSRLQTGLLVCSFFLSGGCGNPSVTDTPEIWVTRGDGSIRLKQVELSATDVSSGKPETEVQATEIRLDPSVRYQQMIGFGGAICDNSAYVFDRYLDEKKKNTLFESLFGKEGIRLNYLRMIMGSTDNSFEWYTYDDMPPGQTDENMSRFTMEKDEKDVIPYYQLARRINPELMILGSPCSPPAWMKTSGHLFRGGVLPRYYPALAEYFVRYFRTMEQRYGLPVEAITIQNEPLYEQYVPDPRYPNMLMTAAEQGAFIKNWLGPAFEREGLDTKILVFDHNWDLYDYALALLNDPEVKKYVAGTGFHCYGGTPSLMENIWRAHPDKEIYHTECSGGGWGATTFPDIMVWLVGDILIGNIENYTSTVLLWYLSTDENAGPVTAGCPSCRPFVTVDSRTGAVSFNPEYYLVGHFSKFIDKGAYRIYSSDTSTDGLRNVAFVNPDGSRVLVVLNTSDSAQALRIRQGNATFEYIQPPLSTVTYVWRK